MSLSIDGSKKGAPRFGWWTKSDPPGNQTWQWDISYKWRFLLWEIPLEMGDFPLPHLIWFAESNLIQKLDQIDGLCEFWPILRCWRCRIWIFWRSWILWSVVVVGICKSISVNTPTFSSLPFPSSNLFDGIPSLFVPVSHFRWLASYDLSKICSKQVQSGSK